ncbi:MAG: type III-B CRISPR module RAMP protein Cmr6 [Pirellulales bacterium]|nr:type III-B CRISPR module RAMP protein Cmr6 [Pirellulales bacterium]
MTNSLMEPLPGSTRRLLSRNTHPGLMLDKYAQSWDPTEQLNKLSEKVQGPTIESVVNLTRAASQDFYRSILGRRNNVLAELGVLTFEATNTGPLTLHLARASALENAGICLHRLYGFTYLPGTSLKGLARAYAETVWFPGQFETSESGAPGDNLELQRAAAAWQKIESVFGHSPGSDHGKGWKPKAIPKHSAADSASAGGVVFHDAWPLSWPPLIKDILNCHHPEYYRAAQPPGDWEDPIPVYFLAVPAGQRFQFAIGRRGQRDEELTALATEWLVGALTSLGVGAKTNSGYGSFQVISPPEPLKHLPAAAQATWETALANRRVAELKATLTLVTPAFLAGASQQAEDCDLRPATLRGLLRWWWRTMHAGFVDATTLSKIEAAIWGDTQAAGAVRIVLEQASDHVAQEYNYKDRFDPQPRFKQDHALGDRPNQKTTQGLFYASYGMDDGSRDEPKHRYYLEPGCQWSVRLTAKSTCRDAWSLAAAEVLAQAEAALWLLCEFGSCGSKARKGFGSLALEGNNMQIAAVDKCRFAAAELRGKLGLSNRFDPSHVQSAALGPPQPAWCEQIELSVPSADAWQVMDHVGFSYQAVAQDFSHNPQKLALGLPRKIHGPRNEPMRNQDRDNWQRQRWLESTRPGTNRNAQNARYASPVWIHVEAAGDQHLVRAIAFPAAFLPNIDESRAFLREFLKRFKDQLAGPLRPCSGTGGRPGRGSDRGPRGSGGRALPVNGDQIEATLVEDPKGKGRRFAEYEPLHAVGAIINAADVPEELKPGDRVTLLVHSITPAGDGSIKAIQFNWPTEALLKQREKSKGKSQGRGPGQGRGRR